MFSNRFFLLLCAFVTSCFAAFGQDETPLYKKNAIGVNLAQAAIDEFSMSFEQFTSSRRSFELTAGLIYVNETMKDLAKDWTNSQLFYENGFSLRFGYKMYKKPAEHSKWRDFIEPILIYKYLAYDNQWFENTRYDEKKDKLYNERFFQHRFRNILGIDFLWGKQYLFNNTFSLEIYYGAGIRGTMASRYVISQQDTVGESPVKDVNQEYNILYLRPSLTVGVKLKVGFWTTKY